MNQLYLCAGKTNFDIIIVSQWNKTFLDYIENIIKFLVTILKTVFHWNLLLTFFVTRLNPRTNPPFSQFK